MANLLSGKDFVTFSNKTAIGSLAEYISTANEKNFQPMNSNWGIINHNGEEKTERAKKALEEIDEVVKGERYGTI